MSRLFPLFNAVRITDIHTSAHLCGFWYTKLQKIKRPKIPRKNAPVFDFDWEHKRFRRRDANALINELEELQEFQTLNDEQKKAFTLGFSPLITDYNYQLRNFMTSHGQHPTDDNLLAKILKLSFKIQYNKYLLEKFPRTITLRGATESLVQRRMRLLRRIRALNKEDYRKALNALNINDVCHLDPFDFGESSEANRRKEEVRAECYQQRLARLANVKKALAKERAEFYVRKEKYLSDLVEKVASFGLERSDAEAKLRDLFEIVIKERQEEALSPTQVDKLQWYSKERVLRRHVINSILEKEAKQLRSRRK